MFEWFKNALEPKQKKTFSLGRPLTVDDLVYYGYGYKENFGKLIEEKIDKVLEEKYGGFYKK